jgi:hypothetical protein
MPAALVGAVSCGRCGAGFDQRARSCPNCGVTLLEAASGAALGTYSGLLAGVAPSAPTRRRLAVLIDSLVTLSPVIGGLIAMSIGAPETGVSLILVGLVVLAANGSLLASRGRSLGRRLLGLRSVDDLTGMPVRQLRTLAGLVSVGAARGALTAYLRAGRDPLRWAMPPLEADALGAEVTRPKGRRRANPAAGAIGRPDSGSADRVVLVLDSGTRLDVATTLLVGRIPVNPEGQDHPVYAWPDLSRSMSKTHALLEWTGTVLWVTDLGSSNGTRLLGPDGSLQPLVPGLRGPAGLGWTVQFGDRSLVVHAGSATET